MPPPGSRDAAAVEQGRDFRRSHNDVNPPGSLELAVSEAIYRTDGVTRRAAALQAHPLTSGPRVTLHPQDAAEAGLVADSMAKVSNTVGTATLQVAISDRVAIGSAWIERGYGATAALAAGHVKVVAA